jgi:two-component system chemotaxis response regulator CheB
MDGLTFLRRLMAYHPKPVIVLSSLAAHGTQVALDALEAGAVEVFAKPKADVKTALASSTHKLIEAIKAAANAKVCTLKKEYAAPVPVAKAAAGIHRTTDRILAIGASTGGTEAVKAILQNMPPDSPAVVVVIHMPEFFTARYAERLNQICQIEVREAQDGDALHAGVALIARGNSHLLVRRSGAHYYAQVRNGPEVQRQRPSVEVLFQSVASAAGANALGVILTGMGRDGAEGLLAMRRAGAHTVAQDEASCVVFGMPKEAIELGAAEKVLPLSRMAQECIHWHNRVLVS